MSPRIAIIAGLALVVLSAGLALWAYPNAPVAMPSHWDISGSANAFVPKLWGLAMWPALILLLLALMTGIAAFSPKGFQLGSSLTVVDSILLTLMLFTFAFEIISIRAALGFTVPSAAFVVVAIGVIFAVIGNVMPKVHKNFFFGFLSPWTLASDEVWIKTHRFAGWLWCFCGIAFICVGLTNASMSTVILSIGILAVLVPYAYSFLIYRHTEGLGSNE